LIMKSEVISNLRSPPEREGARSEKMKGQRENIVSMGGKKTSVYLTKPTSEMLRCPPRGVSTAVSATIERYYAITHPEKGRLRTLFTEAEWKLLFFVCRDIVTYDSERASFHPNWNAGAIRGGVLSKIQDCIDDEFKSHKVDRKGIELKLSNMTVLQQYAIVEVIEEYWEGKKPKEGV
jgi:hypothetical protein